MAREELRQEPGLVTGHAIGSRHVQGRRVRTLVNENKPSGMYETEWNARDDQGQRVASGVYYYVLQADGKEQRRKMTLVK